jgi:hypothetical protein
VSQKPKQRILGQPRAEQRRDAEIQRARLELFESVRRRVAELQRREADVRHAEPIPIDRAPRPRLPHQTPGLIVEPSQLAERMHGKGLVVALACRRPVLPDPILPVLDAADTAASVGQGGYLLWFPGDIRPSLLQLREAVESVWLSQIEQCDYEQAWLSWGASELRGDPAEAIAEAQAQISHPRRQPPLGELARRTG